MNRKAVIENAEYKEIQSIDKKDSLSTLERVEANHMVASPNEIEDAKNCKWL